MATSAKVIKDSISERGDRLTTVEVTMHRWVLAELNTHRVFSRNSASSRAIPVERQLERIATDPAWPVVWASEQPGMQGGVELEGEALVDAGDLFRLAHQGMVELVTRYITAHPDKSNRLHKSLVNRLLEPFMWHTVVITSTEWDNFFGLRVNPLAQPEIEVAARMMKEAYETSTPTLLYRTQWHLPYMQEEDFVACERSGEDPRHVSAARCARVSLLTHDGQRDVQLDGDLFHRLCSARPMHASPLEHVAKPCTGHPKEDRRHLGNFQGWDQLRHEVEKREGLI